MARVKRFKLPEQPDPINPQDVATKAYVDSGGGGTNSFLLTSQQSDNIATGGREFCTFGSAGILSNEISRQLAAAEDFTMKSMKFYARTNTKVDVTIITINLDGIATALTISVPAGITGTFEIVADVAVLEDELISIEADSTSGGGGVCNFGSCQVVCEK